MQAEHVRRAEREISEGAATPGWRIRARIRVARSVTRGEDEFKRLLKNLGVEVEDDSIKTRQRDRVFSLADHPTWHVSGESLNSATDASMYRGNVVINWSLDLSGAMCEDGMLLLSMR